MCRRISHFDPRESTNASVHEYYLESGDRKVLVNLYDLMNVEIDQVGGAFYAPIPVSFRMSMHIINLEWVNLIHKMIFKEQLYSLFYNEFSDVLENIVNTTPSSKDYLVYRNSSIGDTVFHLAAKLWVIRCLGESKGGVTAKLLSISSAMKHALACYADLGKQFIDGNTYTIPYLEDFTGDCLMDHLSRFCDELSSNSMI